VGAALAGKLVIAAALCLAALHATALAAGGDIYVTDQAIADPSGAIYRVDPVTGERSLVAAGAPLVDPADVTFAPDGSLLVTDPGAKALFRVDPATGATSVAVSGGKFERPWGVVTTRSTRAFVTDPGAPGAAGGVFRVNPNSGAKTQLKVGSLVDPTWLALDRDGSLLFSDTGSIDRVYPDSGDFAPFVSGAPLVHPSGVAVDASGAIFVADGNPPATLYRLDRRTAAATPIAFGAPFATPADIAVEPAGTLLVADPEAGAGSSGALIRVAPATGARTIVASGPPFADPVGVAVSPPTCRGRPATVVGSAADDRLVGSTSAGTPDVIAALGGNDRIKALNGSDIVCAGDGNDRVNGGKGKDSLAGDAGADRLNGSAGPDSLDGGAGRDGCDGGTGRDSAKGCEMEKRLP
jgi:sugar lactone lactonase YvrE